MDLLDYEILWTSLNSEETENTIKIILYEKIEDEYKVFSDSDSKSTENNENSTVYSVNLTKHNEYLKHINAFDKLGSAYFHKGTIYVCVGKIVDDLDEMRTNVRMAIPAVQDLIPDFSQVIFEECKYTEDAIYAFVISSYKYNFLKKEKNNRSIKLIAGQYENIVEIANLQNFARFLGDTPANYLTPLIFTEYAKKLFKNDPVFIRVLDEEECRNMKMMLGVGHGSAQESKLLEIIYNGRGEEHGIDVALVGKGVTFDSGGISLKPSANMAAMKKDMMGAGTLLATLKIAVDMKMPLNITGTFPLVENMPGSRATKPGDVFVSMNGITVEVDNTDAEGRLILGDAISYAQMSKPKYLIDAATLTGAMVVSLGSVYGGYFTNNDCFAKMIYESGIEANDFLWRMPLSPFYSKDLKSEVADLNNMGGREGGAIKAAEFLHHFIEKDVKWAHFDIAGLMDESFNKPLYGKCATGRPIPAFVKLLEKLSNFINK